MQNWIKAVETADVELMLSMYNPEGMLVPTFDTQVACGKEAFRRYFNFFLSQKQSVALYSIEERDLGDMISMSGIYGFTADKEGAQEGLARFSFIITKDESLKDVVLSHHSSVMPISIVVD